MQQQQAYARRHGTRWRNVIEVEEKGRSDRSDKSPWGKIAALNALSVMEGAENVDQISLKR